jgi:hypothetical protein
MPNSARIAALIERIRALERHANALKAPFGEGEPKAAADRALTALSLVETALVDAPDVDVLAKLEDLVDGVRDRLAGFGQFP